MKQDQAELAARIVSELANVERIAGRAGEAWRRAQVTQDDYYLDSVALSLHGFYNGVERIFELIAIEIDGRKPSGDAWHRTLLRQMAAEVPNVRPAVISHYTYELLDSYRGFRHLVRNIYAYNFDPLKVEQLVRDLPGAVQEVTAELTAFSRFLQAGDY